MHSTIASEATFICMNFQEFFVINVWILKTRIIKGKTVYVINGEQLLMIPTLSIMKSG